ncbi:plasma membrane proteolipid 3 [Cokeromyces recurvatus]|uniref:plasma membrane proteolipid 3 n=1 Tax=Cokeromyces recurvatus TaxID=90255 RepID=UPI00221F4212|nr:plasma membrane proteolipid 3 [Cokeromyces recurvatus]KAI7899022.1 plasma membrane proteolipid 3 [Cokeromyces recurvatus]
MASTHSRTCKIFTAVILPPLSVFSEKGCGREIAINIALTCLAIVPGSIYAVHLVRKNKY